MFRTRGGQSISAISEWRPKRDRVAWRGHTVIIAFLCMLAYGECPWPWLHHMIYGIKVDQKRREDEARDLGCESGFHCDMFGSGSLSGQLAC